MTENFDSFVESFIREFTTAKSKRQESRYWKDNPYPDSTIRKVRSSNSQISASQKTKIMNQQQYVGDFYKDGGVRGRNKSEKLHDEAGIARGLGGRLRVKGVNPKRPGAKVNSKQGRMEVKYTLGNGVSKVGATGKTDYSFIEPEFGDEFINL